MIFESDLAEIIRQQFKKACISHTSTMDVRGLASRYLEMLNRRIAPALRRVHLSEELHDSLGILLR